MDEKNLDDEYARIVLERRDLGEISEPPEGEERREFARLIVNASDLWIDSGAQITVADVSPAGAALICNYPVELGTEFNISSAAIKPISVKVVACEIDESPTEFLDAQYRVHCVFRNAKEGMELAVVSQKDRK